MILISSSHFLGRILFLWLKICLGKISSSDFLKFHRILFSEEISIFAHGFKRQTQQINKTKNHTTWPQTEKRENNNNYKYKQKTKPALSSVVAAMM